MNETMYVRVGSNDFEVEYDYEAAEYERGYLFAPEHIEICEVRYEGRIIDTEDYYVKTGKGYLCSFNEIAIQKIFEQRKGN